MVQLLDYRLRHDGVNKENKKQRYLGSSPYPLSSIELLIFVPERMDVESRNSLLLFILLQ